MEIKLGVTYSPKELVVETDKSPDEIAKLVDEALANESGMLWLQNIKGGRVGVPVSKLAYVELGEETGAKRVGFAR